MDDWSRDEDAPAGKSKDAPEGKPKDAPEGQSDDAPEDKSGDVPEVTPEGAPEARSEDAPEARSDDAPEDQSDDALRNRSKAGQLARRIMAGDRSAETELVRTYERPLRFILRRQFWDATFIDDVLQETFIRVILRLRDGDIDNPESLTAFLRQTAIHIFFECLRGERKHGSALDSGLLDILPDLSADVLGRLEKEDLIRYVRRVIDELRMERDQDVLVRFHYRGQTKKRICRDLDLSPEHFDRVISRARQRLKDLIDQGDHQSDPPGDAPGENEYQKRRPRDASDDQSADKGDGDTDDPNDSALRLLGALLSVWLTIRAPRRMPMAIRT